MKRVSGLVLAVLMAATVVACGDDDEGTDAASGDPAAGGSEEASDLPDEIVIGAPLDTSGAAAVASVGTDELDGVRLAVEEINSSGFLGDTQIKIEAVDTKADKQEAVQAVLRLISQEVHGIVGFTLTPSFLAAAEQLQSEGVPTVAVGLSAAGVTEVGDYMFRVYPDMGNVIPPQDVAFAEHFGAKRVAYIYQSDAGATAEIAVKRKEALEEAGFETVAEETFTANDTDVRAQLTSIKEANPDLVVATPLPGLMTIVYLQAAEVGLDAQFIGSVGVDEVILEQAGEAMECMVYVVPWTPASTEGNNAEFIELWKASGGSKDANVFHASGYTSMWAMAHAIKEAGSVDGAAIRDAMASMDPIVTPFGEIDFQDNRAASITGTPVLVTGGQQEVWDESKECQP